MTRINVAGKQKKSILPLNKYMSMYICMCL